MGGGPTSRSGEVVAGHFLYRKLSSCLFRTTGVLRDHSEGRFIHVEDSSNGIGICKPLAISPLLRSESTLIYL